MNTFSVSKMEMNRIDWLNLTNSVKLPAINRIKDVDIIQDNVEVKSQNNVLKNVPLNYK